MKVFLFLLNALKEPTNINASSEEYLRPSYPSCLSGRKGLRAKGKSVNATLKTDFDASIGKVNIIPQNIGRVLLNLYNNAFYAVQQKQKEVQKRLMIKLRQELLTMAMASLKKL